MEDLSDEQLEIIFDMCDMDTKGYITSDDLKNLTSDPESSNQILTALRLGPDDALDLQQFVTRVRGLDQKKQQLCRSTDSYSVGSFSEPERTSTLARTMSASDVFTTETIVFGSQDENGFADGCSTIARLSSSRTAYSTTKTRDSDVISRHATSDIFSQNRRRDSDVFSQSRRRSDAFSASTFAGSDAAVNDVLSVSINDLSGKIIEMQESHLESQFEIRSMLSQLSLKIQQDNDRKFEQLVAVVEDRFAARKFDPEEEKHLKCQVERLESEKRSLLTDVSNFRDRVLELTHTIQIRDEELNRERRINDELENRVSSAQQEVNRLMEERHQLKSVNWTLVAKVDALSREIHDTKSLREALNLEKMRLEREKASLAYEAATLANERQKMVETINQQYHDVVNPFRHDLSIEEDAAIEFEPRVEIALQRFSSSNRSGEVLSQVLQDYHACSRRTSRNDENASSNFGQTEPKNSTLTKR